MNNPPFVFEKPQEALSPAYEQAIKEYIASYIEEKKEEFTSTAQTLSLELERMRQELDSSLRTFYRLFSAGYKVLSKFVEIDPEKIALMEDTTYIQKGFDEGKTVQELLGISHEALTKLYNAACKLYDEKDFKNAKDAFYFLTCITPWMQQFWIALGQSQASLGEYDDAIKTHMYAISLDQANIDGYLACIDALMRIHDFEQIKQLCDQGIAFAESQSDQPWAEEFTSALRETKERLLSTSY